MQGARVPGPRLNPNASSVTHRYVYPDESIRLCQPPPGYWSIVKCDCYEPRVIANTWCRQCNRSVVGTSRLVRWVS